MFGPLAVIAAPLLWPVAAILQLLFPVILRDQARAYRWACVALVTESSLLTLHWVLAWLWPDWMATWVPPDRLSWAVVAVIAVCGVIAWSQPTVVAGRPHRLEWAAFGALFAIFAVRAVLVPRYDLGAALGLATAVGLLHLTARLLIRSPLTTQQIFLPVLCLASAAAAYLPTLHALTGQSAFAGHWTTFRGNAQRTGSLDPADAGPTTPHILWRYRCTGDSRLYASPSLADGELIVVATQTHPTGSLINCVYRLDAATGRLIQRLDLPRAGVSSPAVRGPLVVLGEGYHEDKACRLRVLNRYAGIAVGSFPTRGHVESSPALDGPRAFFGAGDDGVFGVELANDGTSRQLWHVDGDHVDAAPLVADGTVFAGSVGEADRPPAVLAIDSTSGAVRWRVPAPLPVIAGPAFDGGQLFVALSNGKLDRDADRPAGALWCLDAVTGDRRWAVPTTAGLYASPVCHNEHVYVAGGDGLCQCLRQSDGGRDWQTALGQRVVASPIVSGGAMFVVTQDGLLAKLDATTGRVVWRYDAVEEFAPRRDVHASPILAGGRIYLAAGGHVLCIGDRRE